jgi:pimeloyl-ACP methyl ester carboxylesterase
MNMLKLRAGGRLAYFDRGSGEPLLLLRPIGGSILSWSTFADVLATRLRVIAFDPRGAAGGSSPAPWSTSTRTMVSDAVELLDHLGLPSAHIYGISLGGMVASWLAVDFPERVRRLVLASTLPCGTEVSKRSFFKGFGIARCMMRAPRDAEACMAARILSGEFRARHPAEVQRIQALARSQPATHRGLMILLAAAARHDVRQRLREIVCPTLLLVGEYDRFLTVESQRELMRDVRGAKFAQVPAAGHDISTEAPERTAEEVIAHVEAADSSAAGHR